MLAQVFPRFFRVPLAILPPADRAHAASWTWHSGRRARVLLTNTGVDRLPCVLVEWLPARRHALVAPKITRRGSGEGVALPSRARGRRAAGKRPLAGRVALRRAARIREYNPHQGGDTRDVELDIFGAILARPAVCIAS